MKISDLTKNINNVKIDGLDWDIKKLAYSTADVENQSMFFCIEGTKTDGHLFADTAVKNGACAVVISKEVNLPGNITKVMVDDTREAMSLMTANFYNNPSKSMDMIGITGTNGKTTSTFLMKSILDKYGMTTGLLGTIYNISGDRIEEAKRTTPESLDLQKMLYDMRCDDVTACVMEVSSHSLELKRVFGIEFKVAVFTNLTQDHLDFHLNMENYFNAKMKLFDNCSSAVINIDDEYGRKAVNRIKKNIITYGIENEADVYASNLKISREGTEFDLNYNNQHMNIKLHLPGKFNVYNALGCIAAALSLNIPIDVIKEGLESLESVPGRSEKINSKKGFTVVIDYAHSPDGILNILKTTREYTKRRLITLFGCGGDRDKLKRPMMGKAAGELSDFCIVTSDNPRSEVPIKIINDIIPGINETKCPYVIIEDRLEAIKHAISIASDGDVIVIAGKGHEKYQVLNEKTIQFDEKEIVSELIKEDF